MKIIELQNLNEIDFHLKNITPHYHLWNTSGKWSTPEKGRIASGLMFLLGCEAFYYINNKLFLHAVPGDIIYLPKNAEYTCIFSRIDGNKELSKKVDNFYFNGKNEFQKEFNAINVRFDLVDDYNEDIIFSKDLFIIKNFKNAYPYFYFLASSFAESRPSPNKIRVKLYQLLSDLSNHSKKVSKQNKYSSIVLTLEKIEKLDMIELTVQKLTEISGLSPSRFRCLFCEYIGISPIKYIEEIKINRAKILLKSGELSVSDVSHLIGITDPAYFSRFYKKITGRKPTDDLKN